MESITKKFILLSLTLAVITVLLASSWKTSVVSAAQSSKGKRVDAGALYKQQCAKCHKEDGKGLESLAPPDFTNPEWQASQTDQQIADGIKEGKGVMPGFKELLSAQEITALVKYVRSFGPKSKAKKK
jgi:mono/diheme cytochrome c family protein